MSSFASSSSTSSMKGIAAIVGVGPKLGRSIARKFAHEGYTVAILARDLERLSRFAEEIAREEKAQVFAIRIDCSDTKSIKEAFEGVLSLGFVEVLVYNAAHQPFSLHPTNFIDIPLNYFEKSLAVSSVGAFHCAQLVLPGMMERGKGTILFTGCSASISGMAGFSELCRVTSMARPGIGEQQKGGGGGADGLMDPDALAQTYWHLHLQDRTAWTQEIDLRPSSPFRFF
ncbi:hypothetical protein KSS87_021881 [Heliosperma pusillum]|nr:hypothetical protein KSS87_021881 [Heliosperma pusillum]